MCPHGPVTVFIVSDVPLYARALAQVLASEGSLEVVGSARDWRDGIECARSLPLRPEILLADLKSPPGPDDMDQLATVLGAVPVVALVSADDEQTILSWAEAGAMGLVSRDVSLLELVRTIEEVAEGGAVCTPQLTATLFHGVTSLARQEAPVAQPSHLTSREREVVHLLAEGLSNKEIAGRLEIELPTVKNHVHHILGKLNARRRGEAVAMLRDERQDGGPASPLRPSGAPVS